MDKKLKFTKATRRNNVFLRIIRRFIYYEYYGSKNWFFLLDEMGHTNVSDEKIKSVSKECGKRLKIKWFWWR